MADWILIPCLVRLRTEFNLIAPGRDRASDGSIGDTAHAGGGTSDHLPDEDFPALRGKDADARNEVHAIDVDADLRTPGLTMEQVVQFLLGRCRSGAETRLTYIIFNRRIWSASNGWQREVYAGENPHDKHAHFSASYDTAREASTASWHLEDLMADPVDVWGYRADGWPQSAGGLLVTENARSKELRESTLPAMSAALAQLAASVRELAGRDLVDEPAIVAGVLAGLDPAAIAAAIPLDLAQRVADELAARLHE